MAPPSAPRPPDPGALRIALQASVVRRAIAFAVIVGAVLIAINHGDALLAGDVSPVRWLKMGLTVIVPYLVSTVSSVLAVRSLHR
jgi:hypothetical protein